MEPIEYEYDEYLLLRECKLSQFKVRSDYRDSLFYNLTKGMKKKKGCNGCILSSYFVETKNMKVNKKLID
jgi:hypothetical protein